MGDQPEQNRRLVTAAEAAEILGIEQRSVRRRINDGKLEGEKAPDGRTWMVWIDESDIPEKVRARLDGAGTAQDDGAEPTPGDSRSLALLPDDNREAIYALHDIITDLQSHNEELVAENAVLKYRLSEAEARLNALPAGDPIPMPGPQPEPTTPPEAATPAPEPTKQRTWWQKLWGLE